MPARDDEYFMRLAIEKTREGIARGQTPFGACIVRQGEVVALAHNVVWDTVDITAHAEVTAIRLACQKLGTVDLSGCVIYSTTEPCPMCFSACHWAKISRVVYGAGIRDAQKAGFNELTIPCATMKKEGGSPLALEPGVLRKESVRLFEEWKRSGKAKVY